MLIQTKFKDLINIYKKTLSQNAYGSPIQNVEKVGTVHAEVRDFRTVDYSKNNLEIGQYIITIAVRNKVQIDIKNNLIEYNYKMYEINNIVNYKNQGFKVLTCQISEDNYYDATI